MSACCDRAQLEAAVSEIVSRCSNKSVAALITSLIHCKDELKAQVQSRG